MATAAQKTASDPKHSAWVGASAGTGKTTVLTGRVLRLLLAGTRPDKILCLTFTKAAAGEMVARINARLAAWAVMEDEALAKEIADLTETAPDQETLARARRLFAEVLDAPDGLRMLTIHAFCQILLKRFPLEAGAAPHFQVIEGLTVDELLEEARLRLLASQRRRESGAVAEAVGWLASRLHESTFEKLMRLVVRERVRLYAAGSVAELKARLYRTLGVAESETEEGALRAACADAAFDAPGLRRSLEAMLSGTATDKERATVLERWLLADVGTRVQLFEETAALYITEKGEPRKTLITKEALKKFPDADAPLLAEQQRMLAVVERLASIRMAVATGHLLTAGMALLEIYDTLKASRAEMDYDDLIVSATGLLGTREETAWVLYKLDGGLEHILVDEAQDTSPAQWQIVRALAEEFFAGMGAREANRTLFVVGDEKQSIFSFQGAEPREFERMRAFFAARITEAGKAFESVPLVQSFRSGQAVLRVVDAVFAQPAARAGLGEGEREIRHLISRMGQAGCVELWPLVEAPEEEEVEPWPLPDRRREERSPQALLAARIAGRIAEWLEQGRMLEPRGRPVQPSDFLILVRHRDALVDELVRALKARRIPVAGVDRMVLTEHIAVMDLMALGHFLLLPEDDLTLACVLKSPLCGIDEAGLFALAYNRQPHTLWERLKQKQHENESFRRAYSFLSALLAEVDFLSPYALYAEVLEAWGGRKALAARLGAEMHDPVDEFLSLALLYERMHPPSLQGFLHWLGSGATVIKRDLEHGGGEVRIMTAHAAKGLQAPIVFLPDTVGLPPSDDKFFWHEGAPLWAASAAEANALLRSLKEHNKNRLREEYNRLLYVALTRAEDELYICGAKGGRSIPAQCWYALVAEVLHTLGEKATACVEGEAFEAWRVAVPQTAAPRKEEHGQAAAEVPALPAFALATPAAEPALPQPLSPSRMEDAPPVFSPLAAVKRERKLYGRGRLVHTLLQWLPALPQAQRQAAALAYLEAQSPESEESDRQELARQVLAVIAMPELAPLFGSGSLAEVPITGVVGEGLVVSGQIDHMAVTDSVVYVVDFKSGRVPPATAREAPAAYVRQMAAYRALLAQVYPGREIRCALVWTDIPAYTPLSEALLQERMAERQAA